MKKLLRSFGLLESVTFGNGEDIFRDGSIERRFENFLVMHANEELIKNCKQMDKYIYSVLDK